MFRIYVAATFRTRGHHASKNRSKNSEHENALDNEWKNSQATYSVESTGTELDTTDINKYRVCA